MEFACGYNVSCFCPHCLQTNFARVVPFSAEMRLGAPHLPQMASIRVLPCLMMMVFFAIVSRIRRSASSRMDCFVIGSHLPGQTQARAYSTPDAQGERTSHVSTMT